MNGYIILSHLHSINRWLVLFFIIWAIVSAITSRSTMNTAPVAAGMRTVLPKGALPAFITTHIQLLLGLILYFGNMAGLPSVGSPSVIMDKAAWAAEGGEILRFYSVTHISFMLAAIVILTVGYMVAKRSATEARAGFWILVTYGVSLIIMLWSIPWPWRPLLGGWM